MALKEKDFVEINYTGKLKDDNIIFDTTIEETAKKAGLEQREYKPLIICIGQSHFIKGLDNWIKGKEPGKYENIEIKAEEAYGKKDAKLIRMVSTQQFTKHKIKPQPGLQINIDNVMGIVRMVTGGRTIVDFNHPLAGKDLIYDIEIIRKIDDKKEQINSLLKLLVNMDEEIEINDNKAEIIVKIDVPEPIQQKLKETIKELVGIESEFKKKEDKQEKTIKETSEKTENQKQKTTEPKKEN